MSKSNNVKSKALGMAHGTAANRLRKMILFSLVCRLEINTCHQCGKEILAVSDLSIEHKEPWLQADDPVASFFDLENIAFSHLSCNVAAANRPTKYPTRKACQLNRNKMTKRWWGNLGKAEQRKQRREKYLRTGR